jgi:hypothetical protein
MCTYESSSSNTRTTSRGATPGPASLPGPRTGHHQTMSGQMPTPQTYLDQPEPSEADRLPGEYSERHREERYRQSGLYDRPEEGYHQSERHFDDPSVHRTSRQPTQQSLGTSFEQTYVLLNNDTLLCQEFGLTLLGSILPWVAGVDMALPPPLRPIRLSSRRSNRLNSQETTGSPIRLDTPRVRLTAQIRTGTSPIELDTLPARQGTSTTRCHGYRLPGLPATLTTLDTMPTLGMTSMPTRSTTQTRI